MPVKQVLMLEKDFTLTKILIFLFLNLNQWILMLIH